MKNPNIPTFEAHSEEQSSALNVDNFQPNLADTLSYTHERRQSTFAEVSGLLSPFHGDNKPTMTFEQQEFLDAFPDGKESVEHQINMYVIDMFAALAGKEQQHYSVLEDGVQFVRKNYIKQKRRIRNLASHKNKNLDIPSGSHTNDTASDSSSSLSSSSSSITASISSQEEPQTNRNEGYANSTLDEVMANMQYVLEFRVKNGNIKNLDIELMKRLRDGLLLAMKVESGSFPRRKLTNAAKSAFFLFGGFIEEVHEFRQAVSEKEISVLRDSLMLDRRGSTQDEKMALVIMIRLVLSCLGEGHDWRDLIKASKHSSMETEIVSRMKVLDSDSHSLHIIEERKNLYPPPSLYIDRNLPKLKAMFRVSFEKGLISPEEILKRREYYGSNELPKPKKKSIFSILWTQLTDFMVILLLVAVVATAIAKEYNSAIVLLVVIVLNTIIGATEEIKAGRALSALEAFTPSTTRVLRNGILSEIEPKELVPGDIVDLQEGDSVPADLRLVECSQLNVIETILTGESVSVIKNTSEIRTRSAKLQIGDCYGNCFMATMVAKGSGRGLVVRTGSSTEIGKISSAINSSNTSRKTPLQNRLKKLGIWLVFIAVGLCAAVVIAGVAWGHKVSTMFLSGLALAVSVIPEGLVAVTTVTMALAVRRMAKRKAIVKRLAAVEVLGSVTCICSDKTGTLTEGKMGVTDILASDNTYYSCSEATKLDPNIGKIKIANNNNTVITDTDSNTSLEYNNPDQMPLPLKTLLETCLLCNNSQIRPENNEWKGIGDPTEVAILSVALKGGVTPEYLKNSCQDENGNIVELPKRLLENPFDSERKRMSVVVQKNNESKDILNVYSKGAPEALLKICTHMLNKSGKVVPLTTRHTRKVAEECIFMAKRGLRVLGMASKTVSKSDPETIDALKKHQSGNEILTREEEFERQQKAAEKRVAWAESNMIFCGLVGLTDPPRSGVKDSVRMSQEAGIKVIMITGDHIETASAIAIQLGILKPGVADMERALAGTELDMLSDEAIESLQPFPNVFARVSPDHKLRIVKALQKIGHVAAMTGDGVNDAPAVRQADIGVAMGIGGTEITKEAADMVLMDDNFGTIIAAVEEGRRVFDNILKFILYLLSCNAAEIIMFLMASIVNTELPMRTIMVLWANIIADVPPAMSVGLEPQEKNILRRPPRSPRAGVLSKSTTTLLLLQAFFIAIVSFAYYLLVILTTFGAKISNLVTADQLEGKPKLIFFGNNPTNIADPILSNQLIIAQSFASLTIIVLQLNQAFLSRSVTRSVFKTGILSNMFMVYAVSLSFALLVMGMYIPAVAKWLELTPLNGIAWLLIFASLVVQIIYVDTIKFFLRRHYQKKQEKKLLEVQGVVTPQPSAEIGDLEGKKMIAMQVVENGRDMKSAETMHSGEKSTVKRIKSFGNTKANSHIETQREVHDNGISTQEAENVVQRKKYITEPPSNMKPILDIEAGTVNEPTSMKRNEDGCAVIDKEIIHDDPILSTPGLTGAETENLHWEKNKLAWRDKL
ncbi:hypothetical protein BB558_003067 [Smittium angustum]|uniref:Cation-transporting P-type ATPase N-terminal domain-containing protein n=1 Tax=Smittium angustum TaxID=133377 RepID=A0A2U1J733_SMIAN|nr:hypothetical protein BB558_007049 [Smittium angustum]PWA00865.1 hypothetical protein BB558_003067 [Smittium angustum]